jgi:hypothetical protein
LGLSRPAGSHQPAQAAQRYQPQGLAAVEFACHQKPPDMYAVITESYLPGRPPGVDV